ncbi:MAG: T9SS type A sorting domain-containing protein [Reichenbachiella sp.]|uniref:T9SS type A sorting domain-containing protein n=1 Tax=Reichenbachiella sp. TaxID=2184521 RepID=UPI003263CC4F
MKKNLLLIYLVLLFALEGIAQSTSPYHKTTEEERNEYLRKAEQNESQVITFSEYSTGTYITNQYQSYGIIFSGASPFITSDGANPTSPVLSGSPIFQGSITGTFVDPINGNPVGVQSFSFDAGYFDAFGSTRVEWFDVDGNKLGQKINSEFGIENLKMTGGNIGSWTISVIENEPSGFAIDNVSYVEANSQLLFREKRDSEKDGSWGFGDDEIPGFDHVGFYTNGLVYESHPGYDAGEYYSAEDDDIVNITTLEGVQAQHTLGSFEYDAKLGEVSPVKDFVQIPIDEDLASLMLTQIQSVMGQEFQFIGFDLDGLLKTLSPSAQKGGSGSFTCVGLVEWAAEQAGHNGGEGFILNSLESVTVPDPNNPFSATIEVPILSPQLLNYAVKSQQILENTEQWVQGFFDPVDFMITDPLGRRLGYTSETGVINEIPNSFYSGDGNVELVLIPKPVPGAYTYELIGVDDDVLAVLSSADTLSIIDTFLSPEDTALTYIMIEPKLATVGDVNEDSQVDESDVLALAPLLNTFTDGLGHPGDIDGDGLLSDIDMELLEKLVSVVDSIPEIEPYEEAYTLAVEDHADFNLQVYPNPFANKAHFNLELKNATIVTFGIYDLYGQEVSRLIDHRLQAGAHQVEWDATHMADGVYIYRLWVGEYLHAGKFILNR